MFTKLLVRKLIPVSTQEILRSYSNNANIRYQLISKIDFHRILNHVEKHGFKEEPLLKAADVDRSREGKQFFKHMTMNALRKKLSIVALDENNEIAGVAINKVIRPGDLVRDIQSFNLFRDVKLKKLLYLIYTLNRKANMFKSFDVDRILEIRLLSVDPAYHESDVRRTLIEKTEQVAKNNGIQLIKADTANFIHQKALKSSQFRTISQVFLSDYKDQRGEPAIKVELPHKKFEIMYRML